MLLSFIKFYLFFGLLRGVESGFGKYLVYFVNRVCFFNKVRCVFFLYFGI